MLIFTYNFDMQCGNAVKVRWKTSFWL